jgi:hypothetical protein
MLAAISGGHARLPHGEHEIVMLSCYLLVALVPVLVLATTRAGVYLFLGKKSGQVQDQSTRVIKLRRAKRLSWK